MRIGGRLKRCMVRAAVGLVALGGSLAAQDRPLPEVAKQKSGKVATRVFTNEDLESAHPPETVTPTTVAVSPPPSAEKDSGPRIIIPGLLEEGTLGQARSMLESLKRDEQVLLRRYGQIQEKLTSGTDEHLRKLYSNSLAHRDETLAR